MLCFDLAVLPVCCRPSTGAADRRRFHAAFRQTKLSWRILANHYLLLLSNGDLWPILAIELRWWWIKPTVSSHNFCAMFMSLQSSWILTTLSPFRRHFGIWHCVTLIRTICNATIGAGGHYPPPCKGGGDRMVKIYCLHIIIYIL